MCGCHCICASRLYISSLGLNVSTLDVATFNIKKPESKQVSCTIKVKMNFRMEQLAFSQEIQMTIFFSNTNLDGHGFDDLFCFLSCTRHVLLFRFQQSPNRTAIATMVRIEFSAPKFKPFYDECMDENNIGKHLKLP